MNILINRKKQRIPEYSCKQGHSVLINQDKITYVHL